MSNYNVQSVVITIEPKGSNRMFKRFLKPMIAIALAAMTVASANAQNLQKADDDYTYDPDQGVKMSRVDRYLDVEVWTNHGDGEYYVGDNVTIKFRANRDAFVAIYSIDSKNRVSLLFPANPGDDNFVHGGVTYRIPDGYADYDLVVSGPEGAENVQIIASRERFSIPDWYGHSGLISDWEDRHEYMDYLNQRYFVRYDGQQFAYDRTAIYINEWEPDYFQPVYYPSYPSWTVYGNFYVDYPYGNSVYINGIYWGCTPLYIPRIYVGWHTISIYDHYGYGWEHDFHVTRYHTVVLDRNVIHTSPNVYSKYKKVRQVGYRAPAANGYPNYASKVSKIKSSQGKIVLNGKTVANQKYRASTTKKYSRGQAKLVKTQRGYETSGPVVSTGKNRSNKTSSYGRSTWSDRKGTTTANKKGYSGKSKTSTNNSGYRSEKSSRSSGNKTIYKQGSQKQSGSSGKSSGYYQRKSGSSKQKTSTGSKQYKSKSPAKSSTKSGSVKKATKSGGGKSSGKSSSVKSSGKTKSSSGAKKSGGGKTKSSGDKKGGGKKSKGGK